MSKVAVIMAGGLGTRLRPYTVVLPKPLMPVGKYPILGIIIKQLANQGFGRIVLAVNHQAEIIKAYFGDGEDWGVKIDYCLEKKQLGTMGPLTFVDNLPESFLVMNGDILTDLDYNKFLDAHKNSELMFSISAAKRIESIDYGVLTEENGQLLTMSEKPSRSHLVSMGVYAVNYEVINFIPPNEYYGFDNLMNFLIEREIPVGVLPHDGTWLDIGRPDDYMAAIELVAQRPEFNFDEA